MILVNYLFITNTILSFSLFCDLCLIRTLDMNQNGVQRLNKNAIIVVFIMCIFKPKIFAMGNIENFIKNFQRYLVL